MEPTELPRISRLTAIITQLQANRMVTARYLADKYGVSIRTIYRDMRTLESSGVPVITEEGKGYTLMEGYQLPPVMFTEDEANAMITAEKLVLENKDASFVKMYSEAIQKVKSILRQSQKEKTNFLSDRIAFNGQFKQRKTSNYLMRIQAAITNFEVLDIAYMSLEQNATQRSVEPFALYSTQENWLLIAFCRLRNDFRAFRLDHIRKIVTTSMHFESHEMTLEDYFKKTYEKYKATPDTPLS